MTHTTRNLLLSLLLGAVFVAACLPGLGGLALYRGDEQVYIYCGWKMWVTGEWLIPQDLGALYLERPPLFFWLEGLAFRLLGLGLFAARLPAVIAGGACVMLVYWLAWWLYSERRTAILSAACFGSFYTIWMVSKVALMDTAMMLGIVLAIAFFARGMLHGNRSLNFLIASLGVGWAGMAKGHIGFILALIPIAGMLLGDRRARDRVGLRELARPGVWLPALLLFSWYYVFILSCDRPTSDFLPELQTQETVRAAFIRYFEAGELQGRTSGGLGGLLHNLWYYPVAVIRIFFPWSLLVAAGFLAGKKTLLEDWKRNPRQAFILLGVFLPVLLLFTFGIRQQARSRYLISAAPAMALWAGRYLALTVQTRSPGRAHWPLAAAAGILVLLNVTFVAITPAVRGKPVEELSRIVSQRMESQDELWVAGLEKKWAVYAMCLVRRPMRYLEQPEDVVEALGSTAPSVTHRIWVLTDKQTFDAIPQASRGRLQIVQDAFGLSRVKIREALRILSGKSIASSAQPKYVRHIRLLKFPPDAPVGVAGIGAKLRLNSAFSYFLSYFLSYLKS